MQSEFEPLHEGDEVLINGCQGWKDGYYIWDTPTGKGDENIQLLTPNGKLLTRKRSVIRKKKKPLDPATISRCLGWNPISIDRSDRDTENYYEWNR